MLSFTRGTGGRRLQALDTLETQQRTQRVELLPLAIHCQQKTPEAARGGGGGRRGCAPRTRDGAGPATGCGELRRTTEASPSLSS